MYVEGIVVVHFSLQWLSSSVSTKSQKEKKNRIGEIMRFQGSFLPEWQIVWSQAAWAPCLRWCTSWLQRNPWQTKGYNKQLTTSQAVWLFWDMLVNWHPICCHLCDTLMPIDIQFNTIWLPMKCHLTANLMPIDCQSLADCQSYATWVTSQHHQLWCKSSYSSHLHKSVDGHWPLWQLVSIGESQLHWYCLSDLEWHLSELTNWCKQNATSQFHH